MRTVVTRVAFCLALSVVLAAASGAQEKDLAAEIEALKQGQQQIRSELAEIKKLLEARPRAAAPTPQRSPVAGKIFDLGDNPVLGESTAKLTLVEFSDYQ